MLALIVPRSAVIATNAARDALLAPLINPDPKKEPIHTFEQFMPLMPPALLEQYVLMTRSGSRHKASRKFPRVIAFMQGLDGYPLILAFSGFLGVINKEDPSQNEPKDPLYNVVELFAYESEGKAWETNEIEFSDHEGPKNGFSVSPRNPNRCYECHGDTASTLHPNWEPYPFWKHAVGEKGDLTIAEIQYLENFVMEGANHPRYQHLNRKRNLELNLAETFAGALSLVGLQKTLIQHDSNRVQRLVSETKDYHRFRYAFLGAFLGCKNFVSFIPESAGLGGAEQWRSIRTAVASEFSQLQKPHADLIEFTQVPIDIATHLRFLMDSRKISYEGWSLSRQHPLFFDATKIDHITIAKRLHALDPELSKLRFSPKAFHQYLQPPTSERDKTQVKVAERFCEALSSKSVNALSRP